MVAFLIEADRLFSSRETAMPYPELLESVNVEIAIADLYRQIQFSLVRGGGHRLCRRGFNRRLIFPAADAGKSKIQNLKSKI
ncbi:MAG: hypothetical protein JGK30_30240 [Microcoleus sp. PH2017_40_RAT_O_B]|jgi:hypothetical protein|uniref:hypothetical protein n=1 Tax=unclassified Microcoleus TaxID=2642155 RepID=UPI001DEF1F16|nr:MULTISPECIES: hypothetical protein [unclassified Microcoleus]MCC3575519.1 hypothetical protein [Microcoleus sp. PH2017_34_RAT_O_A]MCC3613626.1 hypothetical protein [Microcoleus sp. PH2017_40_RAT_O_B]